MSDDGTPGGPVGRVLGDPEAMPTVFHVGVTPGHFLQLDDVVVTEREVPGVGTVTLSGVVNQVRAVHEGTRFGSDVFLVSEGILPAELFEAAEVLTTKVEPEVFVPPRPGAEVRRAVGAERDAALSFDGMERRLPIGLGRDGEPLYANFDFLSGVRGAHVNISGVSGVATKTSYATFLLYALYHSPVLGPAALNTRALIFNVKGEDLLFLDCPNARITANDRERYTRLGLPCGPFASVALYAPPRRADPNGAPHVGSRPTGIRSFWWTLAELCTEELLPFCFADAEDERQQYTMVIQNVTLRLRRDGEPGPDGTWRIEGRTLHTFDDLVTLVEERLQSDDPHEVDQWAGPRMAAGTINAFLRRLRGAARHLGTLVRADLVRRDDQRLTTDRAQVTVVDLSKLHDRAQRFVVGVTLRRVMDDKEQMGTREPLTFVVLDELNKYAPREGTSPIKELLLDVAERGRSLGMILLGAQQTASEVERRVIANASIRVAGRLDPAEAARPEYGFLPEAQRRRATIARPGTMFVNQPELPVPLVVEFPFPAWATRPDEVVALPGAGVPDDPFEGLT